MAERLDPRDPNKFEPQTKAKPWKPDEDNDSANPSPGRPSRPRPK